VSTDVGDHHVPRGKLGGGVTGFECPFHNK
jgi:hypothetical protein